MAVVTQAAPTALCWGSAQGQAPGGCQHCPSGSSISLGLCQTCHPVPLQHPWLCALPSQQLVLPLAWCPVERGRGALSPWVVPMRRRVFGDVLQGRQWQLGAQLSQLCGQPSPFRGCCNPGLVI